jgi:hypothetical protein
VAGGGFEFAFRDNWTVKGEVLWMDLGKVSYVSPERTIYPGYSCTTNLDLNEVVARVGLNYKFGARDVVPSNNRFPRHDRFILSRTSTLPQTLRIALAQIGSPYSICGAVCIWRYATPSSPVDASSKALLADAIIADYSGEPRLLPLRHGAEAPQDHSEPGGGPAISAGQAS